MTAVDTLGQRMARTSWGFYVVYSREELPDSPIGLPSPQAVAG
jgi:hypothetical protein